MTTENKKKDRSKYFKEYAEKNKEKLTENVVCDECGGKYQKMGLSHHIKTKKHQNSLLIKKLQQDNETMKKIIVDVKNRLL
jgi:hypothetical protein